MAIQKYVRYAQKEVPVWGLVQGVQVVPMTAAPWAGGKAKGKPLPMAKLKLLAPAEATKVVCVGLNYKKHAQEMNEPLPDVPKIFMKPSTTVVGPLENVRYPKSSQRVDYECELALVIGKRVGPGQSTKGAIFGYTCANDVSARDLQKLDGQWTRAKGFDTFCPLGPVLVRGLDASDLAISTRVNGQVKQSSRTSDLIFGIDKVLSFIADVMTLLPGDVIITGTPEGIGPVNRGDVMEIEIEKIGVLKNKII
jgi:2-keto-4-pentenoate hydratase/2-oxohepta-3-ene-1,7-dioic acid hydratase in catechol pathway